MPSALSGECECEPGAQAEENETATMKTTIATIAAMLLLACATHAQTIAPDGTWLSPREAVERPLGQTVRVRTGPMQISGNTGTVSGVLALLDDAALRREQQLAQQRLNSPNRRFHGRYTATVRARPSGERYLHFHRSAGTSTD
jgi:hypothetical protein